MMVPSYDIIVIGGGIHGAGVAQAAAAAGYSVLLVEKTAIGAATSSKSSKLIHGGLRYLESYQYNLVKECLYERAVLLRNAPELVKLVPFYIPVYASTSRRPWKIHIGLYLYKLLGGMQPNYGFRKLASKEWASLNNLRQQDLQTVFQYFDAQTDDSALTRAVVGSAQKFNAEVMVPAEFITAEISQDHCEVHIKHGANDKSYHCRVLINAAGPWLNEVLSRCHPAIPGAEVDYVQGSHIIIDEPRKKGVFYVEAPADRRAVFVMPWQNQTMVGTTELFVAEPLQPVEPSSQEISYLLETYNRYFSGPAKSNDNIINVFAGLRVLPRSQATVFHRKRDTQLLVNENHKPRLVSLVGGKLTAYRATADRVIERVSVSLPQRKRRAYTVDLPLTPVGSIAD